MLLHVKIIQFETQTDIQYCFMSLDRRGVFTRALTPPACRQHGVAGDLLGERGGQGQLMPRMIMRGLLKNASAGIEVTQLPQRFVMVLTLGSLFLFCLLCLNAVAILNHRRFLARCKSPLQFRAVVVCISLYF